MDLRNIIESNESRMKIAVNLVAVIVAALIVKKTTFNDTYTLIPIWFFLVQLILICLTSTRLKSRVTSISSLIPLYIRTRLNFIVIPIIFFVPLIIICIIYTIMGMSNYNLQDFENNKAYLWLSLASSIAGILYAYSEFFTERRQ